MKASLLAQALEILTHELSQIREAAKAAHEAATHEESRAEDQHDTRGLEASYLAGAQAQRALEIENAISSFRQLDLAPKNRVALGSVVLLQSGKTKSWHWLVQRGGGIKLEFEGSAVQVLTPASPLGEELMDKKQGDTVEVEVRGSSKEYEVLEIY
jgi:transcription elongation GreA/GreB family factor